MSNDLRIWMEGRIKILTERADNPDTPESARERMLAQAKAYRTAISISLVNGWT